MGEVVNYNLARTLSIVRELALGRRLTLPIGIIAMGEDLTIGFLMTNVDTGEERVGGLQDLTLKELNGLLEKYSIGIPVP